VFEPVAATAIRILDDGPIAAEDWIARVTRELGFACDDGFRERFSQMIDRLDELGLIEADEPEQPIDRRAG
jgi:hypothetical protein